MLIDLWIDVAVHDEQILPAIIVVIEEPIAKFNKGNGRLGNSGLVADVSECPLAIVLEQYGDSRQRMLCSATESCPLFS